ncbi:rhamnulokinase [Domibacillus robiginosus]|uniref:rhamnulokinase n=1 Tax=Domibacillus robiginosus TaxID=1071054 RepID=UPI00067CDA2C|nr:rhamnulokinase [Domibacillus robiginosus]
MAHVAIDIGASSGRLIIGEIRNGKLDMKEVHRFANGFSKKNGTYYWDINHLLTEIVKGLAETKKLGFTSVTAGIDTWAVDYVLIDEQGERLQEVVSYRDSRTEHTIEKISKLISKETIYEKTGIQFLSFNTLYQLYEEKKELLEQTKHILLVPDYLGYCLTGRAVTEATNASTMQLLNIQEQDFDKDLLHLLSLKREQFPPLVQPGEKLGPLLKDRFPEYDLPDCEFFVVGSHDTASAIAGTPGFGEGWGYLSSGTWSLLGIESAKPITTKLAYEDNYTNEWGVFNTYRFLKNIMGMWVIQEVRRHLPQDYNFSKFVEEAKKVKPYQQFINFNEDRFLNPANMVEEIQNYCRETKQPIPTTAGELAACVFSNLAIIYAIAIKDLEEITNKKIDRLHIVGGGSNNYLLNQMTADMSDIPIYAGPSEATAVGNLIMQIIAAGEVSNLAEGRKLIEQSFPMQTFHSNSLNREKLIQSFQSISNRLKLTLKESE